MAFSSCHSEVTQRGNPIFELKSSDYTQLLFSNQLEDNLDLNIFNYMYYYNGAGTSLADFNNDGLIDIFLTSNLDQNVLYINQGNLKFKDVTKESNIGHEENTWSTGATCIDINQDGLMDIYVCEVSQYRELKGRNRLYICKEINSDGIPVFEEKAIEYGIGFKGFSTHAGFFDYDMDGDLDMYLMNHSLHHNGTFGPREKFIQTIDSISGDKLFRNDDGNYIDITAQSGIISNVTGYGLGLAFGDINLDGYPDIYIGNDFHENDYLYINQKDGTFKESINDWIQHTSRFTMGVDIADVNNDLQPDIISLDMMPENPEILKRSEGEDALDIFRFKLNYGYNHQFAKNCLQLNTGNGKFSDIAMYGGIHATDWSWSPLLFDMDLDGQKDIFISNGIPKRMNDIDYINFMSGNDLQFKIQYDKLEESDLKAMNRIPEIKLENKFYLGSKDLVYRDMGSQIRNHQISYSNSAAYADLDNDGDLDVITNNINDKVFLYENLLQDNNPSIQIQLEGKKGNKNALGAKVILTDTNKRQVYENHSVKGFQSSMLSPIIMGHNGNIENIIVVWPDQSYTQINEPKDSVLTISYQEGLPKFDNESLSLKGEFVISLHNSDSNLNHIHEENDFVEFNREILIPHSTSTEGPALLVEDLNGDGTDDVFVGSSKFEKSAIYFQNENGQFSMPYHFIDSTYEEVDAIAFDANQDGNKDIIIATGGNEFRLNSPFTQPLLYINDGKGNFSIKKDAFEDIHLTASCIVPLDFDNDGLTDIFIGARATPWFYGERPQSYLLKGNGDGTFSDVTTTVSPSLQDAGFVTDAAVADMNGDGEQDLILALEWDAIQIYFKSGNTFEKSPISHQKGWWNVVEIADLDNDGDLDILGGNLGRNSRLKASEKEPVRMYYEDFDDNGKKEQILSYHLKGKEIPFANIKELQKQMPSIKKQFLYASDFAEAEMMEIFPPSKLKEFTEANHFENTIYINDGKGNFESISLPGTAQQAPYFACRVSDFNGDQLPDIFLLGNYHHPNIQMGRYDNDFGTLLINQGEAQFKKATLQGHNINGQVKHIQPIRIGTATRNIVGINDGPLQIISLDKTN